MWSGGTDQWGVNQAMTCMSMPHEQVDWASLAQQWIKMKEEAPEKIEEGGELPMEITKDEARPAAVTPRESEWLNLQAVSGETATWGSAGWNWNPTGNWMQWPGTTGQSPSMASAPSYTTIPNSGAGYTTVPNADVSVLPTVVPPAPMYPYASTVVPPVPSPADNYTRGYWTGNSSASVNLPPETVKSSRWDTGSSRKKHPSAHNTHPNNDLSVPDLDAAKRRALPAWIREGLEKMEREKQKKAEQERISKFKKGSSPESITEEISEASITNGDGSEVPQKSRFDSDSESEEIPVEVKPPAGSTPRRSRFDQSEPAASSHPLKLKFSTKEHILQAVMGDVRRILTQLLMEVTSEEIHKAVEETQTLFKKKAPAATLRKTPALASLTGKLGLGIYESDSEDESEPEKVTNDPDSDQEIQDRINRLKRDFALIEENIEIEALELEERERTQLMIGKNREANHEPSQTMVEEQVQPNRGGSTAGEQERNHRQRASVDAVYVDNKNDAPADDGNSVVMEVREKPKISRQSSGGAKDRPFEICLAEKKNRKSSSDESLKSDSSSDDSSTSSSSIDDPRKHKYKHHKHRARKATRKNRYSLSASPLPRKERTRSCSRDSRSLSQSPNRHSRHHRHRERNHNSRSRAHQTSRRFLRKYTPEKELRKRRRSSSDSSDSVRKYRKSSHHRR